MSRQPHIIPSVIASGGVLAWITLAALIAVAPARSQPPLIAPAAKKGDVEVIIEEERPLPRGQTLPQTEEPVQALPTLEVDPSARLTQQPFGPLVPGWKHGPPKTLEQLRAMEGIATHWPLCDLNVPAAPCPSPEDIVEYENLVEPFRDPKNTLTLFRGQTRLMVLRQAPKRVQIGEEKIADFALLSPKELSLQGHIQGSTSLNLWFSDPADKTRDRFISYLVRVVPDPTIQAKLEFRYKVLAAEIARDFPDSRVFLSLVGEKLVVKGQAKDIEEATHILEICRANAPRQEINKLPGDNPAVPGTPASGGGKDAKQGLVGVAGPNVINLLRIPGEQQVMLRVTVAEVNRAAARSIGLNFNAQIGSVTFGNNTGNIATGGSAGIGLGSIGNVGGLNGMAGGGNNLLNNGVGLATNNLPIGLDNGQTTLAINALRNLNYARSLAEPNLVALNGQTANFQAGGQFPVPVVTGATSLGLQGVNFVPYGVQLSFTPYITDRTRIRLNLSASVSTRDLSSGATIQGANISGLSTRNFQTTVELREGQTLAVAGLIQNNLGAQTARIPFFGDIPLLGRALGFDQLNAGEQELVVLITPELQHPLEPHEVPPLPGSDLFEPSDLEFYLLGRIESRRSYDYRSPVMTDLSRMHRYYRAEQIYIAGPSGHSESGDGK